MPVNGTESLQELRQTLIGLLERGAEMNGRNLKGELSPDEVQQMVDLGAEVESYEAKIKEFPTADGFAEKIQGVKSFLRQRATPAPPATGKTARGNGDDVDGSKGGSPQSHHDYYHSAIKSLGDLIVDQFRADLANGRGWQSGYGNQAWSREFKCFDRLIGYAAEDAVGELQPYKAAFDTATSTLTGYDRQPGIIDIRQQRLYVADLIQVGTTDKNTIRYVREDTFTNNAATRAEGIAKPEAAFDTSEVDSAVRKIAVYKKFSEELLDDFSALRSWIDGRLRFMVLQEEEDQLLNGDGNAPNLLGILQVPTIQTETSLAAGDNIEAVFNAITKVRAVGFTEPTGIVIHPTDYGKMRTMRDLNDQFFGGGPFTGAYGNNGVPFNPGLWGLNTVITTAITAGTVLVGNFMDAQFFRRSGVVVQMTNSDQDDFIKNLVTMRAEERGALAVYRPSGFVAVTLAAWA